MASFNNNELSGRTILLVNTGSLKKKFIIQRLKSLGLSLVVLNKEKNWAEPYVDHWILADTTNHSESVQAVKSYLLDNPQLKIEGALTFWEDDVLLTSRIVDRFNFIGIPLNVAKKARNKFLFREFCQAHGIKTPVFKLVKSFDDLDYISNNFSFPLVIKPTYGSSSAYVVKVENKEELLNTFNYLKKNISTEVESALTDGIEILVEEYIDGDEVDIDILLQNGKIKFYSITDNDKTSEPFFVETGQAIPSSLPPQIQGGLIDLAEETLEKMGVQNGVIHFEAKSTKNGPVPIEVNLRMGGDEVHSFIKGAWGVDLIENAVKIALGIHLPKIYKPAMPRKYLTGKYFLTDNSGILAKLDIPEDLKKTSNLEEIHFLKEIGDPLMVPPEGYEFLGWLIVSGYNSIDARDNLTAIMNRVKYEVVKFDPSSFLGKTSRKSRFSSAVLNQNLVTKAARIEKFKKVSQATQASLHLGILGNIYEDSQDPLEQELMAIGEEIRKTLKNRGYKVSFFDLNNFPKVINDLKKSDVDLVFNVGERLNQSSTFKPQIAGLLDALQIPYTGSATLTLNLAQDKISFKKLLYYHGIPTAKWDYAYSLDEEISEDLKYPLIVKPANADRAFGISNQSVVTNKEELARQLKQVIEELGSPALVEEYIEGDEYDVAILGSNFEDLEVLPLARTIFKDLPQDYWHIYTNEAKFNSDPAYQQMVVQRPVKNISKKLESLITEIALDTYNILDCHDYGRVEIRVDKDNNPYLLELNANPSLLPAAPLPQAAQLIGMNYGDLLEKIIMLTIKRYRHEFKLNSEAKT